jgi:hypothetical protein
MAAMPCGLASKTAMGAVKAADIVAKNSKSWTTARNKYWKDQAKEADAATKYGEKNVERMGKGRAPQRVNPETGKIESKELHHLEPQGKGGSHDKSNLKEVWPDEHAEIDPFRRTGR